MINPNKWVWNLLWNLFYKKYSWIIESFIECTFIMYINWANKSAIKFIRNRFNQTNVCIYTKSNLIIIVLWLIFLIS